MEGFHLDIKWEDVTCPICLSFPHNCVLLQCSSYNKGCRPFVCDTGHLHSNCLDRFQTANKMSPGSDSRVTSDESTVTSADATSKPLCPLCRGDVTGWVVVSEARVKLDEKKRCCEEEKCIFSGTYTELREHAKVEHPHACPSKIDPARQLDWENFQQSSEIIDVLSTIHSEVPHGVVLGDYVIEYGDNGSGDEFEDFPGDDGNWWTSCILYQMFDNFRSSRNRRRQRVSAARREIRRLSYDNTSNSDEGSVVSAEFADYRGVDAEDDYVTRNSISRGRTGHRRYKKIQVDPKLCKRSKLPPLAGTEFLYFDNLVTLKLERRVGELLNHMKWRFSKTSFTFFMIIRFQVNLKVQGSGAEDTL